MWSAGYCAGAGLGGFLLMTGLWVGLLIVVVWAVSRIFPVTDRRGERSPFDAHR